MRTLLLSFFLFLACTVGYAQDFEFGKPPREHLEMKMAPIDSTASAVVLREFGTASMSDRDDGYMEVVFTYHVRIKILNQKGFEKANISIPGYIYNEKRDEIIEIRASTFNPEQGSLRETPLDPKKIFTENRSKYQFLKKFTFPNIREGSIVEYSYTLRSPDIFNFRQWDFQTDIPKLHSEYLVNIPSIYDYNVTLRGPYKLSEPVKPELSRTCLRISGVEIHCSKIKYVMYDVPAFVEEDYMTSPKNFLAAIYFELSAVQRLTGGLDKVTKDWKSVDDELKQSPYFGIQVKKDELFRDILPGVVKGAADSLEKAKAIFRYVSNKIKWNHYIGKYAEEGIKKALDNGLGNTADINIALVAALKAAGFDADAVILSTRENGLVNSVHPVLSDFNYVIARLNTQGKSYLLDATEPMLPFGLLPLRCINGRGRVISMKSPSYWVDLKASQISNTRYVFNAKLGEDGMIRGTLSQYTSGYAAYYKRLEIQKTGSFKQYVEGLDDRLAGIRIVTDSVVNLDSIENTLAEIYTVEIKMSDTLQNGQLYFNPFIINRVEKNPFTLNDRSYPVDLGSATMENVAMAIELPTGVSMVEKPDNMAIALPVNGGRYVYNVSAGDNKLYISERVEHSKAIYDPAEYLYLKEFYSRIIQLQKKDIILKK